jgi:hypothetical protein
MGKVKNGIYGPISGKLSNLVWFSRYGQDYVRTKGVRTAALSAAQEANCKDMAVLMALFKNIKPFLKAGFENQGHGTTLNYHNIATARNKKTAIVLIDGKPEIDFQKLLLAEGNALAPQAPSMLLSAEGIEFTWDYDNLVDWRFRNDQAMLIAYFPESNDAIFETSGAKRAQGKDLLRIPSILLNRRMEVYLAFVKDTRRDVSRSFYMGRVN